jgi:thiosulfate/3-mercaptopyruvate sulfurtransferase
LGDRGLAVIDCRFDLMDPGAGHRTYLAGHIPGARYADLNADLSAPVSAASGRHPLPRPELLAATLGRLGIGNDSQVVAYDEANGSFAARLWWLLRWLGHSSVAVLDGGFKAWISAGGASVPGEDHGDRKVFVPRMDSQAVVGSEDILPLLESQHLLLDARSAERYAGAAEPIDPVAGHIPGAVNHPLTLNLAGDGRFLPPEELHRRWAARLAGRPVQEVIAMCGSGVTACHNLLSLEIAGLRGAKLYAGSWSEWIRDPQRPIARGAEP